MTFFRSDGWVKTVLGQAIAGAQIYVCAQPADTSYVPPLPEVQLYADAGGVTPLSQPVISDGLGTTTFTSHTVRILSWLSMVETSSRFMRIKP